MPCPCSLRCPSPPLPPHPAVLTHHSQKHAINKAKSKHPQLHACGPIMRPKPSTPCMRPNHAAQTLNSMHAAQSCGPNPQLQSCGPIMRPKPSTPCMRPNHAAQTPQLHACGPIMRPKLSTPCMRPNHAAQTLNSMRAAQSYTQRHLSASDLQHQAVQPPHVPLGHPSTH